MADISSMFYNICIGLALTRVKEGSLRVRSLRQMSMVLTSPLGDFDAC